MSEQCNYHGLYSGGNCACDTGYYTESSSNISCTVTWKDMDLNFYYFMRTINISLDSVALIVCILNLIYMIRKNGLRRADYGQSDSTHVNDLRLVVGKCSIIVLLIFLVWLLIDLIQWAVDPFGFNGLINRHALQIFTQLSIPMGLSYLFLIIEHCFTLSLVVKHHLIMEQMKAKINIKYTPKTDISIVDNLSEYYRKVSHYKRFYLVIVFILVAIMIITCSLYVMDNPIVRSVSIIYIIIVTLLYIAITISLPIIKSKYNDILSASFHQNGNNITPTFNKIFASSISSTSNVLLSIIMGVSITDGKLMFYLTLITTVLKYCATFITLSIFSPEKFSHYWSRILRSSKEVSDRTYTIDTTSEMTNIHTHVTNEDINTDTNISVNNVDTSIPPQDIDLPVDEFDIERSITHEEYINMDICANNSV